MINSTGKLRDYRKFSGTLRRLRRRGAVLSPRVDKRNSVVFKTSWASAHTLGTVSSLSLGSKIIDVRVVLDLSQAFV